jgi:hypothetical protein
MILPKKKKKSSDEESEGSQIVIPQETHPPRLERIGDNLFIWRRAIQKAARHG